MALIAKKSRESVPEQLRRFVAANLEALEPGLKVLETALCLGRSTVDVVAVDHKQTLVLVAVAEVADVPMLISALDAYIWCLAFPEKMRELYPDAAIATTRPPRIVLVAAQMPGAFLDLAERLSVVNPECHELAATPETEEAMTAEAEAAANCPLSDAESTGPEVVIEPLDSPSAELAARQSESLGVEGAAPTATWPPRVAPQGVLGEAGGGLEAGAAIVNGRGANGYGANCHTANGHATNGHATNGHATNGHASNGHQPIQHAADALLAQVIRAAEPALIEHAAVDLGVAPRLEAAAAGPTVKEAASPKPSATRPALEETRMVNHPALQALRFPKSGVSRQWQEFLDQLAANQ